MNNTLKETQPEYNEIIEDIIYKVSDQKEDNKIDGVIIGRVVTIDKNGTIYVDYFNNPEEEPLEAFTTFSLNKGDIGKDIALVFKNGNPRHPIVMGLIISNNKNGAGENKSDGMIDEKIEIIADKKRIIFNAEKEITLKCGKASITLTSAGKILIRGKYLSSRSSGVNKIKGGSVQIN